jgi:threonine synthase
VAVPETEIAPAVRLLARHGLYTEPTGAIVIAALPRLSIDPQDTTVTVLTGSGLKSAATMARILG